MLAVQMGGPEFECPEFPQWPGMGASICNPNTPMGKWEVETRCLQKFPGQLTKHMRLKKNQKSNSISKNVEDED